MNKKQPAPTRINPQLVREIKLEVISLSNDPNMSANEAIEFLFNEYKKLAAKLSALDGKRNKVTA